MAAPWPGPRAKATAEASSGQDGGEFGDSGSIQIGLLRGLAERPLASLDERCSHTITCSADAVEGLIGDEQNAGRIAPDDLGGLGVRLPVRLEIAGLLHRDDVIERKADVRPSGFEHVTIAVR